MARKKDANHAQVKEAFETCGWETFDAAAFGLPWDLTVFGPSRSDLFFVEVKDGEKPKSATKLTKAEEEFDALLRRHDHALQRVSSIDDVMDLINRRWNHALR